MNESWSRGTAASDSRGHRDRQQTRQLRKVLTLLFSIINEQQSKQIRTEGSWGIPVWSSGVWRYRLGLTPTELLRCEFHFLFRPPVWRNATLRGKGWEIAYIYHWSGGAMFCTGFVGGIMRAGPYSSATAHGTITDKYSMPAEQLNRRALYISAVCWWHLQQDYVEKKKKEAPQRHFSVFIAHKTSHSGVTAITSPTLQITYDLDRKLFLGSHFLSAHSAAYYHLVGRNPSIAKRIHQTVTC